MNDHGHKNTKCTTPRDYLHAVDPKRTPETHTHTLSLSLSHTHTFRSRGTQRPASAAPKRSRGPELEDRQKFYIYELCVWVYGCGCWCGCWCVFFFALSTTGYYTYRSTTGFSGYTHTYYTLLYYILCIHTIPYTIHIITLERGQVNRQYRYRVLEHLPDILNS